MRSIKKPALAFILFIVIQGTISAIAGVVATFCNPSVLKAALNGNQNAIQENLMTPTFLGVTLIISSLVTIGVIYKMNMFKIKEAFSTERFSVNTLIIAVVASVLGIFATNLLSEMLDLPNIIEAQLSGMATNVWGVIAIAIMGPLAEEVVFREAILGYSLRKGANPWYAIGFSALLFGLMHMNPAQIPFAFLIGLILGYVYYRTGNIVMPLIIHILNNSYACIMEAVMGNELKEFKMVDQMGGIVIASIAIVGFALACVFMLSILKKQTEDIIYAEPASEPAIEEEK